MSDLLNLAQDVVGSATINFVKQTMGEFKIHGDGTIDELDQSISVSHQDGDGENEVTTVVDFKLVGKGKSGDDTSVLMIRAHFVASYKLNESFSNEQVDAFARVGGAYNCWPFWREYVHGTCCRLQITPLTAPLMTAKQFSNLVSVQNEEGEVDGQALPENL